MKRKTKRTIRTILSLTLLGVAVYYFIKSGGSLNSIVHVVRRVVYLVMRFV